MGKYFGTDGYRGEAGITLTADTAYRLGRILGGMLLEGGKRGSVVIGKDTRLSCYMLEYAMASGLAASGTDVYLLHVTTTPSVAYVARTEDFDMGVMISASHNPYTDNGIKLMSGEGEKIDDNFIAEIEKRMDADTLPPAKSGEEIGKIVDHYSGRNRYIGYLISLSTHSFRNKKILLDCANGGGWMIAPSVFSALGAKVITIGTDPNGLNINRGVGSTHIEELKRQVVEEGCDLGLAFDGDGDRCIAVDEKGREVCGDRIMYILARRLKREGKLQGNKLICTVMSNPGLYRALKEEGIEYEQTTVGDRYVYERMREGGFSLGGEHSGHIILSRYATTGDGILTGIKLVETLIEEKTELSTLREKVKLLPSVSLSIRVKDKTIARRKSVKDAKTEAEKSLGDYGRIIIRESGTEPVIRILAEAESEAEAQKAADKIKRIIESEEGI